MSLEKQVLRWRKEISKPRTTPLRGGACPPGVWAVEAALPARLLGQWRGKQRYRICSRGDEDALTQATLELASQHGRYGDPRITALLQRVGWKVET